MKRVIATVALVCASFAAQAQHIVDYSWGVVSMNKIEDLSYVEIEGGMGRNGVDFYGFYDINDDGTTFSKVNLSYTHASGAMIEATSKEFTTKDGMSFVDTFYGVGGKYSFEKGGFVKASVNVIDQGGGAILIAGSKPFIFGTSVDGWTDAVRKDGEFELRGNVGVRKFFTEDIYARVATHYQVIDSEADQQIHFQVGYSL